MSDPNILIWPDDHTFRAFDRVQAGEFSEGALENLYKVIHTRSDLKYDEADASALFAGECIESESLNTPLCEPEDDLPITIVTVSRNDEHVERMRERSQAFIDGIIYLATKYKTKTELIIVEWNPPSCAPLMREQFYFPETHAYVSVVIITVPATIHGQYVTGENMPLYQMIGKNVGIRRARGKFVVATNIDILFSEELFVAITKQGLAANTLYRSNRWDVQREILDESSVEAMIAAGKGLTFQVQYRRGIVHREEGVSYFEQEHITQPKTINAAHLLPQLHTMACGDFQMLSRNDWFEVRGYAELDGYSFHLDSLFALMCYHHGMAEHVFSDDCPHFHIDHSLGTEVKSDTYIMQNKKALKHISYGGLIFLNKYMIDRGMQNVNRDNWGLSNFDLPISRVSRAAWEGDLKYTVQDNAKTSSLLDLPQLEGFADSVIADWVERSVDAIAHYIRDNLEGRNFYIWGPGMRGQILEGLLTERGVNVSSFIQGDGAEVRQIDGSSVPVVGQDEVFDGSLPLGLIGIATIYAEEVRELLIKNSMREGVDFFVLV